MNHFKKRLTNELVVSLIIIAALIGGILFFKGNIDTYAASITADRARLAHLSSGVLEVAKLQSQYNEIGGDLTTLANIVPSYYNLINLNKDLQSLAAGQNLSYSFSFAGENPKAAGGFGSVNFNLSVSSQSLNNLLSFLNSLQHFKYLNSIRGVTLTPQSGNITSMSITGSVYYQ